MRSIAALATKKEIYICVVFNETSYTLNVILGYVHKFCFFLFLTRLREKDPQKLETFPGSLTVPKKTARANFAGHREIAMGQRSMAFGTLDLPIDASETNDKEGTGRVVSSNLVGASFAFVTEPLLKNFQFSQPRSCTFVSFVGCLD